MPTLPTHDAAYPAPPDRRGSPRLDNAAPTCRRTLNRDILPGFSARTANPFGSLSAIAPYAMGKGAQSHSVGVRPSYTSLGLLARWRLGESQHEPRYAG